MDDAPLVIVTSHYKEDLRWLRASPYPCVVCTKEGADPPAIPADPRCTIPNIGKESASYIKFIIEYYDTLPNHVAFIHGHQAAWHQRLDLFAAIGAADIQSHQYISLNNFFIDDRHADNWHMMRIAEQWEADFAPYIRRELPRRLLHDCSAQFIVSRDAIRRIPKEGWMHWLAMLQNNPDKDIGSRFEYLWHYIFGLPAVIPNARTYVRDTFTGPCFC
jgi:hypothetical protein